MVALAGLALVPSHDPFFFINAIQEEGIDVRDSMILFHEKVGPDFLAFVIYNPRRLVGRDLGDGRVANLLQSRRRTQIAHQGWRDALLRNVRTAGVHSIDE